MTQHSKPANWEREHRAQDGDLSTGSLLFDAQRQHTRAEASAPRKTVENPKLDDLATFHDRLH